MEQMYKATEFLKVKYWYKSQTIFAGHQINLFEW